MESRDARLVQIGWAYGATDLAFIHAVFDAAGVPLVILGATVHQILSDRAIALGGARVLVRASDVEAGLALLETCVFQPAPRVGWPRIVCVALLSLTFGVMPMPFRGVFLRQLVPQAQAA